MRKIIYLTLLFSVAPLAARAQEGGQNYGLGVKSCAQFAKEYAVEPTLAENLYFAWAEGFLSGMNAESEAAHLPYKRIEGGDAAANTYRQAIRSYCDAHPLSSYSDAVISVFEALPWVR